MRILVWGLGYVGTISAVCLAHAGHEVIGIDPNITKVYALNAGQATVHEPHLPDLTSQAVVSGKLKATTDRSTLVPNSEISLVCVGTPDSADGNLILSYLESVMRDIGRGLRYSQTYHIVVLRSTVPPGTTRSLLLPLLEQYAHKQAGRDFGLVVNPEFLREGSAIHDYYTPPYIILGVSDARAGDGVAALYQNIPAEIHRVSIEEAELLKLVNNTFHALKIGFANEVGRLSEALGLDGLAIMQLVQADTKLNLSPAYLRPGFAFGGSCLPKDLRALARTAHQMNLSLPIIEGIAPSNRLHIENVISKVRQTGASRVTILGLAFKPGTDDLRESPVIDLIAGLEREGLAVTVYDPDVKLQFLIGSNYEYAQQRLPHLDQILVDDLATAVARGQAVVVTQDRPEYAAAVAELNDQIVVVDLVFNQSSHPQGRDLGNQALSSACLPLNFPPSGKHHEAHSHHRLG